jgi:hypothetical protein
MDPAAYGHYGYTTDPNGLPLFAYPPADMDPAAYGYYGYTTDPNGLPLFANEAEISVTGMFTYAIITFILLSIAFAITRLIYRTITGTNEVKTKVAKKMRGYFNKDDNGP